jgi:succinylglutamate desuccinylase
MLTVLDKIPETLLEKKADELLDLLSGPTLIHLPGIETRPLFVSVLLHGNETTGWEAIKNYLRAYQDKPLPRALSVFIGNVYAAKAHKRRLDGQLDYNRIWNNHDSPEGQMMNSVVRQMKEKNVFASLDIHNNTGKNPHYACINRKEHDFFQLAHLFSRTVVYFIKPDSVQSMAFSNICPAVTVECGQPEQKHGVEHAVNYIERVMEMGEFSHQRLKPEDFDVYHTMAIIKVPEEFKISFSDTELSDIRFEPDVDRFNFTELGVGERLAYTNADKDVYLHAIDEQGRDVAERYFSFSNGEIRTQIPVMPSMLTTTEEIIRQDCLCYMMEKIDLGSAAEAED